MRIRVFIAAGFCLLAGAVCHAGPPRFGMAQIADDGRIQVGVPVMKVIPYAVTKQIAEDVPVTKTVIVDGVTRQVTEVTKRTKTVTTTVYKAVGEIQLRELREGEFDGATVDGAAVAPEKLATLLQEQTPVLLTEGALPAYYRSIFKPGTIVLAERPKAVPPAIGPFPPLPPPAVAPNLPTPTPAAPSQPAPPAPKPLPATPVPATPVPTTPVPTTAAPAVPQTEGSIALPIGMAPRLAFLSQVDDGAVRLRELREREFTNTYTLEEKADNGTIQPRTVSVISRSYQSNTLETNPAALKYMTIDGKTITSSQAAARLRAKKETLVLASFQGQPVDPYYLATIRPDALIVISPTPAYHFGDTMYGLPPGMNPPMAPAPPAGTPRVGPTPQVTPPAGTNPVKGPA